MPAFCVLFEARYFVSALYRAAIGYFLRYHAATMLCRHAIAFTRFLSPQALSHILRCARIRPPIICGLMHKGNLRNIRFPSMLLLRGAQLAELVLGSVQVTCRYRRKYALLVFACVPGPFACLCDARWRHGSVRAVMEACEQMLRCACICLLTAATQVSVGKLERTTCRVACGCFDARVSVF